MDSLYLSLDKGTYHASVCVETVNGETTITAYHECESWRVLNSEERRTLLTHLLKAEAAEGVLELVRGDWSETMTEVLVGLGQIVGVDHE